MSNVIIYMNFEEGIQRWVDVDNEIRKHNESLKELRRQRNDLSSDIISFAAENQMTDKIIQITDGKLKFKTSNSKAPLTLKYIHHCLTEQIESEEDIKIIMKYISENREIKQSQDIQRIYNKD